MVIAVVLIAEVFKLNQIFKMSFSEVDIRLQQIAKNLDKQMPSLITAAIMVELSAKHKKRIFSDGIRTDGSPIGEYSQKPGYYSKDKFIRKAAFKGVGKPSDKGKRRTGNKTMFLAKGYSEFRDIQGRKTDKKNLKFSGSLEKNIDVVKLGNATLYGTTDADESIKFQAHEDNYEVFGLSIAEREFLIKEIQDQAIIIVRNK